MKIEIGDKVRFLNDVGGGVVTKIKDRKTVVILSQDGFEVPALVNELVVIEKVESKPQESYVSDVSYNYADTEESNF